MMLSRTILYSPCVRYLILLVGIGWAGILAVDFLRRPFDQPPAAYPDALTGTFKSEVQAGSASIAKVSMLHSDTEFNEVMERALNGHRVHNEKFGYSHYILREQLLRGYWSKPAYILDILLQELAKTVEQRAKWLMWVDADTVIMNPNIPLEIFLPPREDWSHVHCLVTHDGNGLNTGAFFLRVHEWSTYFMLRTLTYPKHHPDVPLIYSDQSAMSFLLKEEEFAKHAMHVPQRWFNAYTGNRGLDPPDPRNPLAKMGAHSFLNGTLLCHFAGHRHNGVRQQRMALWMDVAEQHLPAFEAHVNDTAYPAEIQRFWKLDAPREKERMKTENARLLKKARDQLKAQSDRSRRGA